MINFFFFVFFIIIPVFFIIIIFFSCIFFLWWLHHMKEAHPFAGHVKGYSLYFVQLPIQYPYFGVRHLLNKQLSLQGSPLRESEIGFSMLRAWCQDFGQLPPLNFLQRWKAPNTTKICKQHRWKNLWGWRNGDAKLRWHETKIKEPNKSLVGWAFYFFSTNLCQVEPRVVFGVCILWGDLVIMFHQKEPVWLGGKLRKHVVVKPFA